MVGSSTGSGDQWLSRAFGMCKVSASASRIGGKRKAPSVGGEIGEARGSSEGGDVGLGLGRVNISKISRGVKCIEIELIASITTRRDGNIATGRADVTISSGRKIESELWVEGEGDGGGFGIMRAS